MSGESVENKGGIACPRSVVPEAEDRPDKVFSVVNDTDRPRRAGTRALPRQ